MRLYKIISFRASVDTACLNHLAKISQNADGATHAIRIPRIPPGLFSIVQPEWPAQIVKSRNPQNRLGIDFVFEVSTSTLRSNMACFGCNFLISLPKIFKCFVAAKI